MKNDEQACLSMEDSGIGIPKVDLPYIFDLFHFGRNTTCYPGSGLGLAIVKAIAQANGGQVTVENTSPGSFFTFACRFVELVNLKSIVGRDICPYSLGTCAHRLSI